VFKEKFYRPSPFSLFRRGEAPPKKHPLFFTHESWTSATISTALSYSFPLSVRTQLL